MGVSGVAAPKATTTQVVGTQSSENGSIKNKIEQEIKQYFGTGTTYADFLLTPQNASTTSYNPSISGADMTGVHDELVSLIQSGQVPTIDGGSVTAYMLSWGGLNTAQTVLGQTYTFDGSNWQLQADTETPPSDTANPPPTSPSTPNPTAPGPSGTTNPVSPVTPRGPQAGDTQRVSENGGTITQTYNAQTQTWQDTPAEGDTQNAFGNGIASPSGPIAETFYQGQWVINNGQTVDGSLIGLVAGVNYGSEGNQWIVLDNQTVDGSQIGKTPGVIYLLFGRTVDRPSSAGGWA